MAFIKSRRGNIAIIVGFALPVFLAALALGFELGQWYLTRQAMQNAADSAAVAAASNGGSNYDIEAKAVAATYGFVHGADDVTVSASNSATCPGGGNTCYSVTISKNTPLYLSRMVGFQGSTGVNGQRMQTLTSAAMAKKADTERQYCVVALAGLSGHTTEEGIRCNGCPKADLTGCNVYSNNTATCNGHTTQADIGDAYSTNNGCGNEANSNMPHVYDPYAGLAANIPSDPCGGTYHQAPAKKKDPDLPSSNRWSGTKTVNGNVSICGDLQLTADVNVANTTGDGGVLVIWNGNLDTNGHTLQTSSGFLTVVFAGSNGSYGHAPTGGGELNFAAPRTGVWSGMALYQAPTLTSGVDISEAGNEPTWNITGLVYLPHSSVTFSGAVNKSATNGLSCFAMVVDNIRVNGTGLIFTACDEAGVDLPTAIVPGRGELVY